MLFDPQIYLEEIHLASVKFQFPVQVNKTKKHSQLHSAALLKKIPVFLCNGVSHFTDAL